MESIKTFLKKYWGYIAFYVLITLVIWLQSRLDLSVNQNTILILALILVPILFSRLSSLEYGGVKLQLRELKNEVVETKQEVRREVFEVRENYRQLSEKLSRMAERSQTYRNPQPLNIADNIAQEMRRSINLSDEDIEAGLNSLDPNIRIPAYIQLQVEPRPPFLSKLLDCLWIEQFYARRKKETRPLWQLLVAIEKYKNQLDAAAAIQERERTRMMLEQTLVFLRSDGSIDLGGECKERLRLLIENMVRN